MSEINPNIILSAVQQQRSGSSPFTNLQHIIQFQDLIEQRKQRDAAAQKTATINDLIGRNITTTDQGVTLNRPQFIQQLAQIDPQAALQQQAVVEQQALEQQKIQAQKAKAEADEKKAIAEADTKQLENASKMQGMIGSAAGAVLAAAPENQQNVLDQQLDRLIAQGVITNEMLRNGQVPLNVTPESLALLKGIQTSSLSSKEQLDFELKNRETPVKETAAQKAQREREEKQGLLRSQIDTRFVDKLKKGRSLDDKAVASIRRFHASAPTVLSQIKDLEGIIAKSSLSELKNPASEASAEIGTILGNIQFQVKELFELGALQEPDLQLIDRLTGDPGSFNLNSVRKTSTEKRLGQMSKNLVRMFNNKMNTFGIGSFNEDHILSLGTDPIPFNTVEEAESAKLPPGTPLLINGRPAVVE